jgi:hypothetical protein
MGRAIMVMLCMRMRSAVMLVVGPQLLLRADAGRRAQHGARHRAPDGEQHGEQHQEPEANDFHGGQD